MSPAAVQRTGGRPTTNKITPSSSTSFASPYSNYYTMTMLTRSSSSTSSSRPPPIPEHHDPSPDDIVFAPNRTSSDQLLLTVRSSSSPSPSHYHYFKVPSLLRTFLKACQWLSSSVAINPSAVAGAPAAHQQQQLVPIGSNVRPRASARSAGLGRKVTGTLYGYRRGHVTFAVQTDPRVEPALLVELAVSTSALVKEMSSGLVRIALECAKSSSSSSNSSKLFDEVTWSMYCNGRKCGYAAARRGCNAVDRRVLTTVKAVSVGAGVIPPAGPALEGGGKDEAASFGGESMGELMYMRARFERVVGSRDSEAFYMMNPDGNGGPELSVFLLRL